MTELHSKSSPLSFSQTHHCCSKFLFALSCCVFYCPLCLSKAIFILIQSTSPKHKYMYSTAHYFSLLQKKETKSTTDGMSPSAIGPHYFHTCIQHTKHVHVVKRTHTKNHTHKWFLSVNQNIQRNAMIDTRELPWVWPSPWQPSSWQLWHDNCCHDNHWYSATAMTITVRAAIVTTTNVR